MKLRLVDATREFLFDLPAGQVMVVGRSLACDIAIPHPTMSRRHSELEAEGNGVRLRDLGSTNGTYLNGLPLAGEALAVPGDVITFGKVALELEDVMAESSDEPAAEILRRLPVVPVHGPAPPSTTGESLLALVGTSVEERQERRLALLLEISSELSRQGNVDRLLEKIADLTFQVMDVERVAVLLLEAAAVAGEEPTLVPRVARGRVKDEAFSAAFVPRSIARRAVAERAALLTGNAVADERFSGDSILMQRVQSAMCAPLVGIDGEVIGVLYVDNRTSTHSFGEEELEFLSAFSSIAAVAVENSRLVEQSRREAVVVSNFQRYFAPRLARQIAQQEGELHAGGDRRQVVVLFSDIRGFTSLSEGMGPDAIVTLLNEYFTEMVQIVFDHDGVLDKFIGDAVMALWGAPIAAADDADRAVAAAIEMQTALVELNRAWTAQGRPPLEIGIGINVGEVFAGNIGSDQRLEYTVIGDAVNTAARLCATAGPGELLVSEALYDALAAPPPVASTEELSLKGKAAPVKALRLAWRPAES